MLTQNSIQARLRGDSLPTTIKQANPIVTNLSDIVAVKEYETHTILVAHHSVVELPITLIGDSIVHQAFDLTHWSRLVDSVSMDGIGAKVKRSVPLSELSHSGDLSILQSVVYPLRHFVNKCQHFAGIVDHNLFAAILIPIGRGSIGELNNTHHDSSNGGNVEDQSVNERFHESVVHWSNLFDSVSIAPIRAKVNPPNDHQNLWVSSGGLMVEFSTGLWKTFNSFPQVLVFLWKTINIHNHHQISIFSVSLVCDPYFVL